MNEKVITNLNQTRPDFSVEKKVKINIQTDRPYFLWEMLAETGDFSFMPHIARHTQQDEVICLSKCLMPSTQ